MLEYEMKEEQIEEYFASARERYSIMLRRRGKDDKPWTEDPVFQNWRFCNVFREDDKVTEWIRLNVREPLVGSPQIITAMAACRIFNRLSTLEKLKKADLFFDWDGEYAREILLDVRPIVGAAYVVKTPDGKNKLDGCIEMITAFDRDAIDVFTRLGAGADPLTLEAAWEAIQMFPCIGRFMAYEIVSDLRHTHVLEDAPDVNTWACPGPGCCRGLSYLVAQDLTTVPYGGKVKRDAAIRAMQLLLLHSRVPGLWPVGWPRWEMREVEHWLCEYAKYAKVAHLGQTMKVKFEG